MVREGFNMELVISAPGRELFVSTCPPASLLFRSAFHRGPFPVLTDAQMMKLDCLAGQE